jgi:outer membrane protein assembly factor BamB
MVVFATKAYGVDRRAEVFAFDLASGTEHWRFRADSPGDFMASPLAVDLNADGYDDVVLGNGNNGWQPRPGGDGEYGSTLYALDGRTGAVLWQRRFGSGQHARVVQAHGSLWVTESYGQFTRLSLKGEQEASWSLSRHEAVGVFATPVLTRGGRLVVGSSTWGGFPDALWSLPVLGDGQTSTQPAPGRIFNELMGGYRVGTGRISASAVLDGDRVWVVTEDGALIELRESAEGLPVSRIHGLPAGSECPPLIIAQGASETRTVIVAGNDGMLRCFKLGQ